MTFKKIGKKIMEIWRGVFRGRVHGQ